MTQISPIGVMQGRLLPKYKGRYQAHPVGNWQEEFPIAGSLGLDVIEFILDYNDVWENPLMSELGIDEILEIEKSSEVGVKTICADYFMEAPLHSEDERVTEESARVFSVLVKHASRLAITDIVLPCVDGSSLRNPGSSDRLLRLLESFMPDLQNANINLALETDLAPKPFLKLLSDAATDMLTVNYDSGNSAALGFDPEEEFDVYGDRISDIHIKDRTLGGGPVVLGSGDTEFSVISSYLKQRQYDGPIIMQAYRDDQGVDVFKHQMSWLDEAYPEILNRDIRG